MEDKLTNQEKQLKVLTEDFALDIDTSELWDKVEAQLPPVQREKRRPIVWWFASGILVTLFSLMVWSIQSKNPNTEAVTDLTSQASSPIKIQKTSNTDSKHTDNSPFNTNPSTSINTQSKNTAIENTSNTLSDQANQSNFEAIRENTSTILNSNRYDEKSSIRKEVLINQGTIDRASIAALINPSSEKMQNFDPLKMNQERPMVSINPLGFIGFRELVNEMEMFRPQMQIKPVKSVHWLPYYAFYSGTNLHKSKIYSDVTDGFNSTQFENENPLIGLSSSIQIGRESNNGWRFGIGLNHSMLVNRFSQTQPDTSITSVPGNTTSKIDDEGIVTHLTGDLVQTTITKHNIKWHRKHDFVNLQLNIGRQIFRSGKMTLFTDANFNRNIWSRHTGYFFNEGEERITKFTSGENNPYSNAGYSVGLSMDLEYKLKDFSISFRPFASFGLSSITKDINYYQIKNSLYGVQLGVVYRP